MRAQRQDRAICLLSQRILEISCLACVHYMCALVRVSWGAAGGIRIFTSVLQAVVNIIDHRMTPQQAVRTATGACVVAPLNFHCIINSLIHFVLVIYTNLVAHTAGC